jgi:hypothetical protein
MADEAWTKADANTDILHYRYRARGEAPGAPNPATIISIYLIQHFNKASKRLTSHLDF